VIAEALNTGNPPVRLHSEAVRCMSSVNRETKMEIRDEFLADDAGDPSLPFLKSLLQVLDNSGTIIVYSKGLESGVLESLGSRFPELQAAIKAIQDRLWDFLPVVRSHTYHPALVPEMTCNGMEISEGEQAGIRWDAMIHGRIDENETKKVRDALLAYCRQDTLAMVRLLELLRQEAV